MLNIKLKMEFKISQKGAVSLYLALITMIILLAIGLGITTIIISQMRMIRGIGDSVVALYAADAGIERILYEDKMCHQTGCSLLSCKTGCYGLVHNAEFTGNLGDANYVVNHKICPDFDGDGIVGSYDDSIFAGCDGSTIGDDNYDPKCDFDGDGTVGFDDFTFFSGKYSSSCRGYNIYKSSGGFKQIKRAIEVTRKDP